MPKFSLNTGNNVGSQARQTGGWWTAALVIKLTSDVWSRVHSCGARGGTREDMLATCTPDMVRLWRLFVIVLKICKNLDQEILLI